MRATAGWSPASRLAGTGARRGIRGGQQAWLARRPRRRRLAAESEVTIARWPAVIESLRWCCANREATIFGYYFRCPIKAY